jgi:hypothetical protein
MSLLDPARAAWSPPSVDEGSDMFLLKLRR